jgi:hypothetical protein
MDYDRLLDDYVGQFGLWQKLVIVVVQTFYIKLYLKTKKDVLVVH